MIPSFPFTAGQPLILPAVLQIFFAVIILGLSGHLVATQVFGGAPSQTNFTVFLGIWGLVIGLLGIVASFVGALQGLVMLGLDVFGCLLNFAGGIVSEHQLALSRLPRANQLMIPSLCRRLL